MVETEEDELELIKENIVLALADCQYDATNTPEYCVKVEPLHNLFEFLP
jgi:hypothetical protein